MATEQLIALGSAVGTIGSPSANVVGNIRVFQLNPRPNSFFTGKIVIEETTAPNPTANDWVTLATFEFINRQTNAAVEVESSVSRVRARVDTFTAGETVAVFFDSRGGQLQGGSGTSLVGATLIVDSPKKTATTSPLTHVKAPTVFAISTDDVQFSVDLSKTATDVFNDILGAITPSAGPAPSGDDLAVLAGVTTGACTNPLTTADLCLLTELLASSSELNQTVGASSNLQVQLDALSNGKADGAGVDLTGLTVPAAYLNSFFDANPTVTVSGIATNLAGLTATAADLNTLTGTATTFTAADLAKLGLITASASEINSLTGFVGSSTDLNKVAGMTTSVADLNAITGLAGTTVGTAEFTFLQGLSENVQLALNNVPNLGGLTAAVGDLNLLTGASTGTGAYSGSVTATEISYLDGLTSNIQIQIDGKRDNGVDIGISEISGASITTVELNYLQGATANIQAQIDALSLGTITTAGGTFIGPIFIADGTAAAPGLGYASANTTGLYLEGAPGMGFSVAGVRAASLNATDFVVGDNATSGQPLLKHSGFGEANPPYSFVGDPDTGVFWPSADSVALAAGGERMVEADGLNDVLTLGGPVATNNAVTVTGIAGFEKVLSSTAVQGGASGAVGQTALYTVPVGRSAVVTKMLVILTNVTGFVDTTNFRMNIGFTAPNYDEIVDNITNTNVFNPAGYAFDTALQVMPLGYGDNAFPAIAGASGADYQVLTSGAVLTANVTVLANAADYDYSVVVFGYEF